MKRLIYSLSIALLLFGCSGQKGDVGPQGDKGATGEAGPKGDPGEDGSKAYTYDFNLDLTTATPKYTFEIPIADDEIVFVFLKSKSLRTLIPYIGYAFDITDNLYPVDMNYEYGSSLLFVYTNNTLPKGTTFAFRAVVIKGTPGKRLNFERYKDYENVKADFGLKD